MSQLEEIALAGRVLFSALQGEQREQQAALAALQDVLVTTFAQAPQIFPGSPTGPELHQLDRAAIQNHVIVESLLPLLKKKGAEGFVLFLLERLIRTAWMCGGTPLQSRPSFSLVGPALMEVVRHGPIDMNGFAATLIGRYGPEAADVLPELLELLLQPKVRGNCGLAPGLAWAAYQIGGMCGAVKEAFLRIACEPEYACVKKQVRELLARSDVSLAR